MALTVAVGMPHGLLSSFSCARAEPAIAARAAASSAYEFPVSFPTPFDTLRVKARHGVMPVACLVEWDAPWFFCGRSHLRGPQDPKQPEEVLYISAMQKPSTLFFLPGALGRTEFWHPVSGLLNYPAPKVHVTWPGFSGIPPDPRIRGIGDLVARVLADIDQPSALIAQSMGGVVAMLAALQKPELVTHLVLSATSGGMDLAAFDGEDWRPAIRAAHPGLPDWFTSYREDLTPSLSALRIPTLLLWGDADPISPVKVGRRLASLLPQAELQVVPGGDHNLGCTLAGLVAPLIDRHLAWPS
jgi:pimeloyl-ACP methyl ester carboxylesterase